VVVAERKLTRDVAMRAEQYAEEALAWIKSDGIARKYRRPQKSFFQTG
jgi:phage gp46-like protein